MSGNSYLKKNRSTEFLKMAEQRQFLEASYA